MNRRSTYVILFMTDFPEIHIMRFTAFRSLDPIPGCYFIDKIYIVREVTISQSTEIVLHPVGLKMQNLTEKMKNLWFFSDYRPTEPNDRSTEPKIHKEMYILEDLLNRPDGMLLRNVYHGVDGGVNSRNIELKFAMFVDQAIYYTEYGRYTTAFLRVDAKGDIIARDYTNEASIIIPPERLYVNIDSPCELGGARYYMRLDFLEKTCFGEMSIQEFMDNRDLTLIAKDIKNIIKSFSHSFQRLLCENNVNRLTICDELGDIFEPVVKICYDDGVFLFYPHQIPILDGGVGDNSVFLKKRGGSWTKQGTDVPIIRLPVGSKSMKVRRLFQIYLSSTLPDEFDLLRSGELHFYQTITDFIGFSFYQSLFDTVLASDRLQLTESS